MLARIRREDTGGKPQLVVAANKAQQIAMDAVGVGTHHDSITGTSVQATVFSLHKRLHFAALNTTYIYEKLISEAINKSSGNIFQHNNWTFYNTSANSEEELNKFWRNSSSTTFISVHNPNTQNISTVEFSIPFDILREHSVNIEELSKDKN